MAAGERREAPGPIVRQLLTIHIHELDTGEVWGEVLTPDGEQLSELTEDGVTELLDGFAEILGWPERDTEVN